MKKTDLRPDAVSRQYVWWLKRVHSPIGSARKSKRIPVLLMSEFYRHGSSKEARSIDVKHLDTGHISRQDLQVLQVMTADEEALAREQQNPIRKNPGAPSDPAVTPSNSIVRRDGVAREMAKTYNISIVQANRNLRQMEQTYSKLLLLGNQLTFMDWMVFEIIETPEKRVGDVRGTGETRVIPASRKLKVRASQKLAKKIKGMAA